MEAEAVPQLTRRALLVRLISETEALLESAPWPDLQTLESGIESRQSLLDQVLASAPPGDDDGPVVETLLEEISVLDRKLIGAIEEDRLRVADRLCELRRSRRGIRGYAGGRQRPARYFERRV